MKRIGVFALTDKTGVIDSYVEYCLDQLYVLLDRMIVVTAAPLGEKEKKKIEKYSAEVCCCTQSSLVSQLFKYGMEQVGYDHLEEYQSLILMTDKVYGPVYSLNSIFEEMEARNLDFWGISMCPAELMVQEPFSPSGYINAYLENYFVVFEESVLRSEDFSKYWSDLFCGSPEEEFGKYTSYFTRFFAERGFSWDILLPKDLFNEDKNILITDPLACVKEYNAPFVKTEIFEKGAQYYLSLTAGQQAKEVFWYLKDKTSYNTEMIMQKLLRTCNLSDIVSNLCLYEIESSSFRCPIVVEKTRAALVMHLYYMDLLDESLEVAKCVPAFMDIHITCVSEQSKEEIEQKFSILQNKVTVHLVPNRGRVDGAVFLGLRDILPQYDVVCLYHDKKSPHVKNYEAAKSFAERLRNNVVPSAAFVYNVFAKFQEEPQLGILCPAVPNHSTFYDCLGMEWGADYALVEELLRKLEVKVPFSTDKPPVACFGDVFWFRPRAIKKLYRYSWKLEDFPAEPCGCDGTILHAIERCYPYLAQEQGYYTSYLFSDTFASVEMSNLYYYLRTWNLVSDAAGIYGTHAEKMQKLMERLLPAKPEPETEIVSPETVEIQVTAPQPGIVPVVPGKAARVRYWLKRHTSPTIYGALVKTKRHILGPHDMGYDYNEADPCEQSVEVLKVETELNGQEKTVNSLSEEEITAEPRKVSVIVPNYNYARYLEERIDSILNQTYPIHELILLDDCSTDNSVEVLERKAAQIQNIPVKVIVNDKNSGNVFSQWKKGMNAASGDFIWIAEADDSCHPEMLKTAMKAFEERESVVLSYVESSIIDEKGDITLLHSRDMFNIWGSDHWEQAYINSGRDEIEKYLSINNTILNASSLVLRKKNYNEILEKAKTFRLAGDWYFYTKILEEGDIAFSPEPLNLYRMHAGVVRKTTSKDVEYGEIVRIQEEAASSLQLSPSVFREQRRRRQYIYNDVSLEKRKKRILWVTSTPVPGSGGHRTIIQNINALAGHGYECDLFLFDYAGYYRTEFTAGAALEETEEYCGPCSANVYVDQCPEDDYVLVFATVWNSVQIVANMDYPNKAYFVQDYEPWFFSMGQNYLIAEQSYHYGLQPVTIGRWLAQKIGKIANQKAYYFDFCADTTEYHPIKGIERKRSVCAIYQPGKPRRCPELVVDALIALRKKDADVEIYVYGSQAEFPDAEQYNVHNLHILNVEQLNELYNNCTVGLSVSTSNPSRIPFEMLAAGLPVVELDLENNRYDFPEECVTLATPTANAISETIYQLLEKTDMQEQIRRDAVAFMKDRPLERGFEQFLEAVDTLLEEKKGNV